MNKKILYFIATMILTIAVTRFFVFIHNPTTSLFGFELHHFDYGIVLLLVTALLLLFTKKTKTIYTLMAGVSFGLIADDIWFIRSNINDPSRTETMLYNATLESAIIITGLVIVTVLIIRLTSKNE